MNTGVFRSHAPDFWAAGLPVIPLRPSSKIPAVAAWNQYCSTMPKAAQRDAWLKQFPNGNIGLPLGEASGVVALDVDAAPIRKVIELMFQQSLPATWQRVGKKGAVYLFRFEGQATQRFRFPNGEMAFELLSTGAQVVVPPSIHPDTAEPYTAEEDLVAAVARAPSLPQRFLADLASAVGAETVSRSKAASSACLCGGKIAVGGRDIAATQMAGVYAREVAMGRKTLDTAEYELEAWFVENIDQSARDPITFDKYREQLAKFFLEDITKRNAKGDPIMLGDFPWYEAPLGWDEALTPGDLHRLGLLGVHISLGSAIPQIARDFVLVSNSRDFIHRASGEMFATEHLVTRYAPNIDGRSVSDKLTSIISSSLVERVDFARLRPKTTAAIVSEPPYRIYNTFKGFSVTPGSGVNDEDVAPFLELTALQVPDEKERNHLLDWEAHLFQHPDVVKATCPMLYSSKGGTGKNSRVEALGSLFHRDHFRPVDTRVLESQFNAWRDTTILAFVDEVESANRAETNRAIKSIVGNALYERNQKHQPTSSESGYTNLYLSSNKPDALRLDEGDRRIFLLEINDTQAEIIRNKFDFGAFKHWLDQNRHKLLGWLLERDISAFNPHAHAPMTAAKRVMINKAKPRWQSILDHELETESGRFAKDLVCTAELLDHLLRRHQEKTPNAERISWWLRTVGAKSLGRKRTSYMLEPMGAGFPKPQTTQTTVWAVRNAKKWRNAANDQISQEMLR